MPRLPRVHLTGALYYVTSRAMESLPLFRDAQDYETYLALLRDYQERFGFTLFAYALLPNEVHVCLELTNQTTISTIMHALNSRYTKSVAKRYGTSGHVFQERFRLTLMEKAPHLVRITAALHRLPQRSDLARDPRTYRWSSYPAYLSDSASEEWRAMRAAVAEVRQQLEQEMPGVAYDAYVQTVSVEELARWEVAWQKRVVGSEAFVARVEAQSRQVAAAPRSAAVATSGVVPAAVGPVPMPRPSGPRPRRPLTVPLSLSITAISLGLVALAARNVTAMRQTVRVLAQERTLASLVPPQVSGNAQSTGDATFATFTPPSALAGTVWTVQVKPMYAAAAPATHTDELRFESGKVISALLGAQGFSPSNYSLSLQANGSVLWETMQTGPNREVICWRGEWDGKNMRGVMTRQLPGQVMTNFAFVGTPSISTPPQAHSTKEI